METISVAMCTYNGAEYVKAQLESILNQELKVDEIVVCDDGSKDETISIVKNIANYNPRIRIVQNERNIGFVQNFAQAISACTGNIIFLSDQDDIWMPNKTKEIVRTMQEHPEIDCVSTDAYLIDEVGEVIPNGTLWKYTHLDKFDHMKKRDLIPEFVAATGRVTGATLAFRNTPPYNKFLYYQGKFPYHDEVISYLSIISDSYYLLAMKLMKYRLSSSQSCGLSSDWFDRDFHFAYRYVYNFKSLPLEGKWKYRLDFIEDRLEFKTHPWRIITNWKRYKKYYGHRADEFRRADIVALFYGALNHLQLLRNNKWMLCDYSKM